MTNTKTSCSTSRRALLLGLAALSVSHVVAAASAPLLHVQVWKDANCGCCSDWVAHLEKHGFTVRIIDKGNSTARARLGMPQKFASCHTALIQGFVIEGHVAAGDILRLIKEHPQAIGLAVPGMPIGSPGMDGAAYGGRRDAYQVLLVRKDGSAVTFNSYS
jgi:hypothetical protein